MSTREPSAPSSKPYPFDELEPKWQQYWLRNRTFRAPNPGEPNFNPKQPKYYVLDMFPYPSGSGLHVGHPEGYTATDILTRFKRMCGYNVLHPMGWDAFGLPAEQYAIKTGQHPAITTADNIARFKGQLQRIGFAYDWDREVNTTDAGYFRWTQWIFLQIYNSWFNPATGRAESISTYTGSDPDSVRLAYVAEAPVNWCPGLGTVLANEEVIDGKSEVGDFPVERRPMKQWMLRITAYAERLIDELTGLDWPEGIKTHQRNWIGRSEGAEVTFPVAVLEDNLTVFTTRPDTLFGATYMVLAPEHALVERITTPEQRAEVDAYRKQAANKSDRDRAETKEKTGVFTGSYAINPVNDQLIPIWIADYVLMGYGTGAIMAVPAHDERDGEFARKFGLPIIEVVARDEGWEPEAGKPGVWIRRDTETRADGTSNKITERWTEGTPFVSEYARLIASGDFTGTAVPLAKRAITAWLAERGRGVAKTNYKLRDWLFSRQRYWGEPFPIVWENGRHRAVPEGELPVTPPKLDDFRPTGTPEPPLSKVKDWVAYSATAAREVNTMPQWAGSCWYYLRYIDPANSGRFVGAEAERYWMNSGKPGGVDLYVGGTEHAVLHLLYARFWHKVLFDLGHVSTPEPFQRLVNQGLILGDTEYWTEGETPRRVSEDEVEKLAGDKFRLRAEPTVLVSGKSYKMSKSRGNVVNPDDIVQEFGADALRCYEMFMGPLEASKSWSTRQVEGITRFLARVWRLVMEQSPTGEWSVSRAVQDIPMDKALAREVHATLKKVGEVMEGKDGFSFNTAIAQMMICTNALTGVSPRPRAAVKILLQALNPFAPHLTEELWERLGCTAEVGILAHQPWPAYDPALLIADEVELTVQVNGKLRGKLRVKRDLPQAEIEAAAHVADFVQPHIAGKKIARTVVVPNRLVNIVAV